MFSTLGLVTALVCAGVAAAIAAYMAATATHYLNFADSSPTKIEPAYRPVVVRRAALVAGIVTFIATKLIGYYEMPVTVGPFAGYGFHLLATLLPAFASGLVFSAGRGRNWLIVGITLAALPFYSAVVYLIYGVADCGIYTLLLLPFLVGIGVYTFFASGFLKGVLRLVSCLAVLTLLVFFVGNPIAHNFAVENAKTLASLPKINEAPKGSTIPPSDPNHLLLTTGSIARFKGETALATLGDKEHGNLSSKYKIGEYDKQAVGGKRYWIAPLTLANSKDQWNIGSPYSPGYVVVDAEDPEAPAQIKLGYHIRHFEDQDWGLYLSRFLYESGFSGGYLEDPKFEVNDAWEPYWVISYLKPVIGNVEGRVIEKTILVKETEAEAQISSYDPNNAKERTENAWVDRVMSYGLVKEYMTNWGMYQGSFAQNHFWQVFFNVDRTGTLQPGNIDLCYTKAEENVWVIPMTSTKPGSHGVTGLMVYETNRNEATWYPEIQGFNIGSSVIQTMEKARDNVRGYHVEHVQLMSIYGELTWVGIYTAPQSTGSSFGGVGFLHAHAQNPSDVVFADKKATALQRYADQLANGHTGGGNISQTAELSKEISGKVISIAALPSNSGASTWLFKVEGQSRSFTITRDVYSDIPLVKEGHEVKFTYIDTHTHDVPVNSFKCPFFDNIKDTTPEVQPQK
ncbi:MAG: hypothetical protein K2W82_16690 [Candidatus Obscuribacterales bacterium]|nr:hypothetical protein [Candidatus Obscuribacterales bacterium]